MEAPSLTFGTTTKGRPMAQDKNNYTYVSNNASSAIKYWKCSVKACPARIRTRVSSSNLVGTLPTHLHENRFLKRAVREKENAVIKRMSKVDGVSNTTVLSTI